jgi:hypothetical protein
MSSDRYDVFISYARADAPRARLIREKLAAAGLNAFFDAEGIDNGADFPEVIDRAVRNARCVLGLWSRNAFTGRWVRIESRIGLDQSKLVAAIIDGMRPEDLPAEFYNVNVERLDDYRGQADHAGWARVLHAIGKKLGRSELGDAPPAPSSPRFNPRAWFDQLPRQQQRMAIASALALGAIAVFALAQLPGDVRNIDGARFSGNRVFSPSDAAAATTDITGAWRGSFFEAGREIVFDVDISPGAAGAFSGTITETNPFGMGGDGALVTQIDGQLRSDGSVSFVKAYNGAGGMTHRVQYEGRLEDGGRTIVGAWDTGRTRGDFRMRRP